MKQLGILLPILLLLGVGITSGLAAAELMAGQQLDRRTALVGETVTVMVSLTNTEKNVSQASVTPYLLPSGVMTSYPETQFVELSPGVRSMVSYPIWAEQSGYYEITSLITYSEEGNWRQLTMSSDFTAT